MSGFSDREIWEEGLFYSLLKDGYNEQEAIEIVNKAAEEVWGE